MFSGPSPITNLTRFKCLGLLFPTGHTDMNDIRLLYEPILTVKDVQQEKS